MEMLKIVLTALGSIAVLFLLTKLMGNKQMSELSMFDYIIGISIGSIAAEAAIKPKDFLPAAVSMTVYAVVATAFSVLCNKSVAFRRIGFGKTLVLYKDRKFYRKNMQKAKLDINELSVRCRIAGYFDFSDLSAIFLEPNGKISFLPLSSARPTTPADFTLSVPTDKVQYNVIEDGRILQNNLSALGKDVKWLMQQLKTNGYKSVDTVFFAVSDGTSFYAFSATDKPTTADIFE